MPDRVKTGERASASYTPPPALPRWRSHKVVEAARIAAIEADWLMLDPGGAERELIRMAIPEGLFARGRAKAGDYLVRYENVGEPGVYYSWSPAAAFEAGYTRISDAASH